MAEKSSEGYDYWTAVDVLRHELEQRARTERRASETYVYTRRYGGDVEAKKNVWREAMEAKGKVYRAYMDAFEKALDSGQPMPECGCE